MNGQRTLEELRGAILNQQVGYAKVRSTPSNRYKSRKLFVLATSHNNKLLATIIEFVIDCKTMNLYAMSERQGEKLFHMNENNQVSLAYVGPAENYFRDTPGVQIVGKAQLLSGKDPGFEEGLEIYLPTIITCCLNHAYRP